MSNWDTKFLKKGFTFDDVLLIPAESHVLPNDADLTTKLADNLTLNIPIITAANGHCNRKPNWPLQSHVQVDLELSIKTCLLSN